MKKAKDLGSHAIRGSGRRRKEKKPRRRGPDREFTAPGWLEKLRGIRLPDKKYIFLLLAALAAVLVIVLSAVSISTDKSDYKRYMTQAAELYGAEDYDGALSFLRKAAAIERRDECLILMADCYEAQGNIGKAIETLQKLRSNERSILRRIAQLEQERARLQAETKIALGEVRLDPDEKNLNLEGMGLTDTELEIIKELRMTEKLSLKNNSISDISALSALTGIVSLNLSGNSVEDISPLLSLKGLRNLNLDFNPVADISILPELKNLRSLSLIGLGLNEGELRELSEALPGCAVYGGEEEGCPALITMGGISFTSDITVLDLSGRELTDINALNHCRSLRRLDLSSNTVTDLSPVMNNPELEWLDISDNLISDLRPLMGIKSLETVIADNNRVSGTAALGGLENLQELRLSGNPIGDFSGLAELDCVSRLSLKNTGLTDSDLEYLKPLEGKLSFLELDDNPELSGEAVELLQIELSPCLINHSPLLYSVKIGGVTVKGNTKELDLSSRGISDISELGKLSMLESLKLSDNEISNIYIFQFAESRESLKHLDLSGNNISDITPIASLTNLESLDLSGNQVSTITPFLSLTKLRMLKISGNLLTEEQLETLRVNLKGCEIVAG